MNANDNCIFCNFDKKYVISENKHAIATYFPRAIKKGHFVVAVKKHIPTFTELDIEQARDIIDLALKLAKVAEQILNTEKFYIVSIGDKDHHFHFHLLPKQKTDTPMGKHIMLDEGWKGEVGESINDDEVKDFIEKLKNSI